MVDKVAAFSVPTKQAESLTWDHVEVGERLEVDSSTAFAGKNGQFKTSVLVPLAAEIFAGEANGV